jgi:hypothetical protein
MNVSSVDRQNPAAGAARQRAAISSTLSVSVRQPSRRMADHAMRDVHAEDLRQHQVT